MDNTQSYQVVEPTSSSLPDETGIEELLETIDLTTADDDTTLEETTENEIDWNNVSTDIITVLRPEGEMAEKLAKAAPYNIFFTTITASQPTHNQPLSVTFQGESPHISSAHSVYITNNVQFMCIELLDSSLGELESSVQINFVVSSEWLLEHYKIAGHS